MRLETSSNPRILVYDIETGPLPVLTFRLGEQVIRHNQLLPGMEINPIICIAYSWVGESKVHLLTWDPETRDQTEMIKEFDKVIAQADIVIGKNNIRFDDKWINTHRLLTGNKAYPEWVYKSEDLEQQMRRVFNFPSHSLDYVAKLLLGVGKTPMEFDDWKDIFVAGLPWATSKQKMQGQKAFKKMCSYCKVDVKRTKQVLDRVKKFLKFKFNTSAFKEIVCCVQPYCGSTDIKKNGTSIRNAIAMSGKTKYQLFHCNEHGGYAGRRPINAKEGTKLTH